MLANNAKSTIIYPDLSYKVIGAAFRVYNVLGYGLAEKAYQVALATEFQSVGIQFHREVYVPIVYGEKKISRYFADFMVENKILLELKVVNKLGYVHAKQTLNYLRSSGLKLGILLYFTGDGVKYRRIINSRAQE